MWSDVRTDSRHLHWLDVASSWSWDRMRLHCCEALTITVRRPADSFSAEIRYSSVIARVEWLVASPLLYQPFCVRQNNACATSHCTAQMY